MLAPCYAATRRYVWCRPPRTGVASSLLHVIVALDTTASRFTGASIAGLVVGAMGVFVFNVALRHWLGQRRRFREEARA